MVNLAADDTVHIHDDHLDAAVYEDGGISKWLSDYTGVSSRLVCVKGGGNGHSRPLNPKYSSGIPSHSMVVRLSSR